MKIEFEEDDKKRGKIILVFLIGLLIGITSSNLDIGFLGNNNQEEFNLDLTGYSNIPEECEDREPYEIDMCIANFAISTEDEEMCEDAQDSDVVNYCLGIVKQDSELCEEIEFDEELREMCNTNT